MKDHEHAATVDPETKPSKEDVARKAYEIYVKEGWPHGLNLQS